MYRLLVDSWAGQIHLRRTDGSGRPLVVLHMTPLSSSMWIPLMNRLERPVVAPDRIGFGCSDAPPRQLDIDEYARATLDVIDTLAVEEFDVLGEHTGSVEAVALAHLAPNRVGKIGLVSIPAYTEEERRERLQRRAAALAPVEDGSHLLALWERRLAYRQPPYDLEYLHQLTVEELTSAGAHHAYRAVFAYSMMERLAALGRPVVVFAPRNDLSEQTERARVHLPPGSTYVDLPELSLDIFELVPDRMASLVELHLGEQ